MRRPFVDFYRENAISPVRQDIDDLNRHFERRASLYRVMGIAPHLLAGTDVLEFGPGSGHNALYTASLGPRSYVLVDGNPTGLRESARLLEPYSGRSEIRFVESMIEDYEGEPADLVICEGTIPFQHDPAALARRVARFARPGGLIVITTVDDVSYLAEGLRRLMCECIAAPALPNAERLEVLRPLLVPHLRSLTAMSRLADDWIWDNILQPLAHGPFSIPDAIVALAGEAEFYGSSPAFTTEWRWYKELYGDARDAGPRAMRAYLESVVNFLDCRVEIGGRIEVSLAERIVTLCGEIVAIVLGRAAEAASERSQAVLPALRELHAIVAPRSQLTGASLAVAIEMFEHRSFAAFGEPTAFASFFGRGQQHATFMRRAPLGA